MHCWEGHLGSRGLARARALENELPVVRVDVDGVAVREFAFEQPERERVLDHPLQRALEWACAVGRIPAGLRDDLLRLVRQFELDAALFETFAQAGELQLDDLAELFLRQ